MEWQNNGVQIKIAAKIIKSQTAVKYNQWSNVTQIMHIEHAQYTTEGNSIVQYSTVQYSTVQCSTVQYSTVQYSTVQYSTVQYSTVQYSTLWRHLRA